MVAAITIAVWSSIAFLLWLLFSAVLRDLRVPLPKMFGAVLAWVAAGLLLNWALPWFGHQLGLPWAYAHTWSVMFN